MRHHPDDCSMDPETMQHSHTAANPVCASSRVDSLGSCITAQSSQSETAIWGEAAVCPCSASGSATCATVGVYDDGCATGNPTSLHILVHIILNPRSVSLGREQILSLTILLLVHTSACMPARVYQFHVPSLAGHLCFAISHARFGLDSSSYAPSH